MTKLVDFLCDACGYDVKSLDEDLGMRLLASHKLGKHYKFK